MRTLSADSGIALTREGQPAVRIRIDRSARGDAIAIQDTVARIADEMQAELPAGVEINLVNTRADNITDRLDLLLRNGLAGLALVLMLLFLFLSGRSAIWVAAGIPVAMAAALAAMWAGGLTLNMVSLFGLLLCLGLVVDDAIVVAEHADWRRRHLDEGPAEAAENAARRMALPVFCAMITTVLAFAALTAVGGRFGRMVSDIPFTVIAVLAASLVECFLILPHHMARALAGDLKNRWIDAPSRAVNRGLRSFRERAFKPAIGWVIRLRYPIIAAALLLLAQSVALFLRGDVPWRFFVSPDRGTVTVNLAMLPGATRTDTTEMVRELERATAAVDAAFAEEHGLAPVEWSVASVGDTVGRGLSGDGSKPPDALGGLEIGLTDPDLRSYSSHDFVARLREAVVRSPEVETLSFRSWRGGPGGDGIDVALMGGDVRRLKAAAEDLKAALALEAGVFGLEDSLSYDRTELILDLTPQGARLGFDIDAVGAELFARLSGVKAAEFHLAGASAEVRVSLPEDDITADSLDRARLPAPDGAQVPLAEIVEVESRPGFASLERENGLPVVRVTGGISEDDPEAASAIETRMRAEILPAIAETHGVEYSLGGLAEQESRFLSEAAVGFTLCAAGIYLTLAWVFSSWVRPLIVLAVIPFGLVGTIWGHLHWDLALSMFSVVGLIGLAGIIVNNAIVLISTVDAHAERRALAPSLVEAAGDRLRPVLLTTLTTVLGLTPLLFERSRQALFLKPTVVTLVYGLGIGAVLTMVLVPALLMVQHDISRALLALRRSLRLRSRSRHATLLWAGLACVALASVAALLLPSTAGDAAATWIPRALLALALAAGIGGLALGSVAARR